MNSQAGDVWVQDIGQGFKIVYNRPFNCISIFRDADKKTIMRIPDVNDWTIEQYQHLIDITRSKLENLKTKNPAQSEAATGLIK
jgi:hypothetical protein